MVSNLALLWTCQDFGFVLARGLTTLVMPIAFAREAESKQHTAIFLPIHFGMTVYTLRVELLEDGVQWLANLLIGDNLVLFCTGRLA